MMNKENRKKYHISSLKKGGLDYGAIGKVVHNSKIPARKIEELPEVNISNVPQVFEAVKKAEVKKSLWQRFKEWIKKLL